MSAVSWKTTALTALAAAAVAAAVLFVRPNAAASHDDDDDGDTSYTSSAKPNNAQREDDRARAGAGQGGGGQGGGQGGSGQGGGQGQGQQAPKQVNGSYQVIVSGFYKGEGHVAVGAGSVNINVRVTSESGQQGRLHAPRLVRDGNYFSGQGTLLGHTVTLTGRLEPPDGQVVLVSRLSCHLEVSDGHYGLIAGQRKGN
jgi:hypothetical protein